jgi:hypothetical protein
VNGSSINIRISAKNPLNYVEHYSMTAEKLRQQFIEPEFVGVSLDGDQGWLKARAAKLADEVNASLASIRGAL